MSYDAYKMLSSARILFGEAIPSVSIFNMQMDYKILKL